MAKKISIVLDTNILISAIGFGGKPREVLQLVLQKEIQAVSSPTLLAELANVVTKKFPLLIEEFEIIQYQLEKILRIVRPQKSLHVVRDESDNSIIEAAVTGACEYIITGDKDLLILKTYQNITILTPEEFLEHIQN